MIDQAARRKSPALRALIPLALLGALIAVLVSLGPRGIFPGNFPPVQELKIQRVTLHPGTIKAVVTNGGASPVTVAQVLVDDAYWEHTISPSATIKRLGSATVTIDYPWVPGEPVTLTLVASTGLTFSHVIDVAVETPSADGSFLLTFALLGALIGVVPVLMGMAWRPFLSRLSPRWNYFFMAFTVGILLFLGIEALAEAISKSAELPTAMGGLGIVAAAAVVAFVGVVLTSARFGRRSGMDDRFVAATSVALGIGLHNMGEGLAVGASYRLGEIALGTFLVIGFAIHNTTEGLGIVSILGDSKPSLMRLAALGLLAGLPTILGTWAGAFFFSPLLAVIFLGVAAGAIAQVVYEVMKVVGRQAKGGLASIESLTGIAAGLVVMYLTGLLISAG